MHIFWDKLSDEIKQYYNILVDDIPDFLFEYINTPEMHRIKNIGMHCGTDYTGLFNNKFFYSRLEHSIGVSLIVWHFTRNKQQALAGLFHDIATPSFSHCIDYLHRDYLCQEYTENNTMDILKNSDRIMNLLSRDGILLEEVVNYKNYPIADNLFPKLSADRLEYTLSSGMSFTKVWNLEDVAEIYSDLCVFQNENGVFEIGFKTQSVAERFVVGASKMWKLYQSNTDKVVMQFFADIIGLMIKTNYMTEEDLYFLGEREIINLIENCGISEVEDVFRKFRNSSKINQGMMPPLDEYCVHIDVKKRYINPLVNGFRLDSQSSLAKKIITDYLNSNTLSYGWFDFKLNKELFQ